MMTIGELIEKVGIVACVTGWAVVVYCPKHPEKGKFVISHIANPPEVAFSIEYVTPDKVYPPFQEIPVEGVPDQIMGSGIRMQDSAEGWVLSRGSMDVIERGFALVSRELESIKKEGLYES